MATVAEAATRNAALLPRPWRVVAASRESHDVVTLELESAAGETSAWQPGQFNMLYAFGIGEVPISFSGGDPRRLRHSIREVGTVSRALAGLVPGTLAGVRGPYGSAWPLDAARGGDVVIAAGGIGLAPLKPLVERICAERNDFGSVSLLYGARTPVDRLFGACLADWRAQGIDVAETVDHADAGWTGQVGVVTTLVRRARFDPATTRAFLCGPEIMMRFTALELERAGLAPTAIALSMERNMQCALGWCGHCQLGPWFVCLDGPVFDWPRMRELMMVRGL
ncbi:MAG: FAD/NAD(P)-binding protein [Gammaproteobacteria bacterium]|nr:FAD/NAD(P)-binding protein [Gammaproteobacteria bacterium]